MSQFLLEKDEKKKLEIYYAPFEYVNEYAQGCDCRDYSRVTSNEEILLDCVECEESAVFG